MLTKLVVSPSQTTLVSKINQILAEHNLKHPHPDLLYLDAGEKLGVETAKKIREHLSLKPIKSNLRGVVIIQAEELTSEAQNSLLKSIEEPPGESLIILGTPSEDKLLPTIVSRCELVYLPPDHTSDVQSDTTKIEQLLKASVEERFVFIEKLEDKEGFLQELTSYFQTSNNPGFLKELLQANLWASQNVNLRAILEYLMLKMPTLD